MIRIILTTAALLAVLAAPVWAQGTPPPAKVVTVCRADFWARSYRSIFRPTRLHPVTR